MFKPLSDRVLIRRDAEEEQVGSIILSASAQTKPHTGTVVAVGPGRLNDKGERNPLICKLGMQVAFGKYAGDEIDVDDETHLIMRESEILGWIEPA